MRCRRKTLLATTGLALVAVTGCSTGHPARPGNSPDSAVPTVQASRSHCGQGWTRAVAGKVQVTVRNTDVNAEEVYLADDAGKLYGEVDPLGPGASAALRTSLAAGTYHLVCSVNDGSPVHGPDISVTGDAAGAPGVQPVTSAQLAPAVIGYQRWVTARLKTLQGEAKTLTAALRRGDVRTARSAWRAANRTWNTMGGGYGAFGDLGEAVAGDAYPFPDGVRDAHWTGLLRIEYGLWHGQSPASLASLGGVLEQDLTTLRKHLQTTQFQPIDVVNRTHEITEDTLQQTLTGHHDYGAHVQLPDALAQLDGTAELLDVLHPLLAPRFAGLAEVDRWIAKTRKDIREQDRWKATPADAAPSAGHQHVVSDISQLAELLTPVPTILEPRVS